MKMGTKVKYSYTKNHTPFVKEGVFLRWATDKYSGEDTNIAVVVLEGNKGESRVNKKYLKI